MVAPSNNPLESHADAVSLLRSLNRSTLTLIEVSIRAFGKGWRVSRPVREPRLILCERGQVQVNFGEHRFLLRPGRCLFLPRGVQRVWEVESELALRWFRFDHGRMLKLPTTPAWLDLADPWPESEAVARMRDLFHGTSVEDDILLQLEAKAVLARFFVKAKAVGEAESETDLSGVEAINKAIHCLATNLDRADALDLAQETSGYDRPCYQRQFRRQTGMQPAAYLLRLRMRQAHRMLQESPRHLVKEVAYAIGFRDPLYFSRVYRRYWGHPPREDR